MFVYILNWKILELKICINFLASCRCVGEIPGCFAMPRNINHRMLNISLNSKFMLTFQMVMMGVSLSLEHCHKSLCGCVLIAAKQWKRKRSEQQSPHFSYVHLMQCYYSTHHHHSNMQSLLNTSVYNSIITNEMSFHMFIHMYMYKHFCKSNVCFRFECQGAIHECQHSHECTNSTLFFRSPPPFP